MQVAGFAAARENRGSVGCGAAQAVSLLDELTRAHDNLLAAMAEMAVATGKPDPSSSGYLHTRWKLSHASRQRRSLVASVCAALSHDADPGEAERLAELRSNDLPLLRRSAAHVQHWTMERIAAEWPAYREASHRIREEMKVRITAERTVLYPMLRRRAAR
jgi:hypothetical protein